MSAALSFVASAPLPCIGLRLEQHADVAARETLLDCAMGKRRKRKSSETLRRGRLPADGLALVAEDESGSIIGTVRLWHVDAGGVAALLLGPLAVSPQAQGGGIGTMLMERAIAERQHNAAIAPFCWWAMRLTINASVSARKKPEISQCRGRMKSIGCWRWNSLKTHWPVQRE